MNALYLKKGAQRRLQRGHPWVYSNEVDIKRSPLKTLAPGSVVVVTSEEGKSLGVGFASPASLVCVRLLSRQPELPADWLLVALERALAWRQRCYADPYYRLVFAEGDGLPGLVEDRYDDLLVVQVSTWGMDQRREEIAAALAELVPGARVCFDDSSHARSLEGLPSEGPSGVGPTVVIENGVRLQLPEGGGQKTGWFFDQRSNRRFAQPWYKGAQLLDLYSYAGGWGIQAAA